MQCHGNRLVKFVLKICEDKRILSWLCCVEFYHSLNLIASTVNQIFNWILYKQHLERLDCVPSAAVHDIGTFNGCWCFVFNSFMKNKCSTTLNYESEHIIGLEFSQVLFPGFVSLLIRFLQIIFRGDIVYDFLVFY